jgi:2-C-methyl-D-erythritol 4-phosphate cytidylyltransferase
MKKIAVIVAGGGGMRMGTAVPKQFLPLQEHAVLWYTLDAFLKAYADLQIVLVVPAGYQDTAKEVVMTLAGGERVELAIGGDTRFHSVRNGLESIRQRLGGKIEVNEKAGVPGKVGQDMVIWVHDGVRCLITADLIRRCYEQAVTVGSAVPVIDCRDSVRLVEDEGRSKPIDRSRIKLVQTPQTFRGDILLGAYMLDHQEAFTDEATVVEVSGHTVQLIEGEFTNIKITTPEDMVIAEAYFNQRMGQGSALRR